MKDESDNKTEALVEVKPKTIETELGTEKYCKGCDDYYPETKEFFFGTSKTKRDGTPYLEALCKACYNAKYKRSLTRTNNVSHRYVGVAT